MIVVKKDESLDKLLISRADERDDSVYPAQNKEKRIRKMVQGEIFLEEGILNSIPVLTSQTH